jgi:hypothetical protein
MGTLFIKKIDVKSKILIINFIIKLQKLLLQKFNYLF